MRHRNQRIYSDIEHLRMLADEQKTYIGRSFKLDEQAGCLTVFALPARYKKKDQKAKREKEKRERRDRAARVEED